MKSPEEYVDAQCTGPERPEMVTHAQATAAVKQALLDAERYKNNLLGALRRAANPEATRAVLSLFGEVEESPPCVQVGGQLLPWRAVPNPPGTAPRGEYPGEEPPF